MLRITLLILIVLLSVILAECQGKHCDKYPCTDVISPYCVRDAFRCGYPKCFERKGGREIPCDKICIVANQCTNNPCDAVRDTHCQPSCFGTECKAICYGDDGIQTHCTWKTTCRKQIECDTDPCFGIISPYCERKSCDSCDPRCFDRKGDKQRCSYTTCHKGKKETCSRNPCLGVINQYLCKSDDCDNCVARCFNRKGGKEQQCDYRTCDKDVCEFDPCFRVISEYCEPDACYSCAPNCFDRKGGKEQLCEEEEYEISWRTGEQANKGH